MWYNHSRLLIVWHEETCILDCLCPEKLVSKLLNFIKYLCILVYIYCRPISDVSSDLTIEVGATSFSLHKVKRKNSYKFLHRE